MVAHLTAAALAGLITDPSARGIAARLAGLIGSGHLERGMRLPTVRSLALALHVGPTTVASAWTILRKRRLIRSDRRSGTFVCDGAAIPGVRLSARPGRDLALDLSGSKPDPGLLPDLGGAMADVLATAGIGSEPVGPDARLEELVRADWPFAAEAMTPTLGGRDAVARVARAVVRPHDRVVVESVCRPSVLDIVDDLAAIPVPVRCDEHGPRPDDLAAALETGPVAMVFQPRMADPHGHALTVDRALEIHRVLAPGDCLVIEDDRVPALAVGGPPASLGSLMPDRTVLARSWNTSHGLQLGVGVLAGAADVVSHVRAHQRMTGGLPSGIAQGTLAMMLGDTSTRAVVARAGEEYARRRLRLVSALERHGILPTGSQGLSVWLPTPDPQGACAALAARGIGVAHGTSFAAGGDDRFLRVGVAWPHERQEEIACVLASAAHVPLRPSEPDHPAASGEPRCA